MEELKSRLLAIGQNLQQLGGELELLKTPIQEALEAPHPDVAQIKQLLLDELYDAVLWGAALAGYEELLGKLEKYNPQAADFTVKRFTIC
ncbi:hypothetical protein [Phaeodactylibacter luteus]|uniref:Uncharacterized protein n=1 Tax=Phaeodactylibacter luteus TaxID=1564516 RepID=A0A5C6RP44_9BACT|nr:hypothetical protein [Phaeodactylibacter luteus]TXB63729.1 hypothetical protein FRY97_07870 [Phaeodactylibacter luteus]